VDANRSQNDHIFLSHVHTAEDGFVNLDDASSEISDDEKKKSVVFSKDDIDTLAVLQENARMSPDIRGHLHNVVVFARLHRAVRSGVSAMATRHFHLLSRALAPLHNLSYVAPFMVAMAFKKVYAHRIIITTPENERSMQWGSDIEVVKELLDGLTVEDILEEVLESVESPL
jgi:MoxR-like ATPase